MTLKTSMILATALILATPVTAAERTYDLNGFTGVNVARGVTLTLSMGPESISTETNAANFDDLYIDVDKGVLEVRRKSAFTKDDNRHIQYTVTVTAPTIDFLKASTGAVMTGENLQIETADIEANTGAAMTLSGTCNAIAIEAHTGATVDSSALLCARVTARGRTGAMIRAYASEAADGKARMGAEIDFKGDPKTRKKGTFLGGDVSF